MSTSFRSLYISKSVGFKFRKLSKTNYSFTFGPWCSQCLKSALQLSEAKYLELLKDIQTTISMFLASNIL